MSCEKRDNWPIHNQRRGELIDKDVANTISDAEREELSELQIRADIYLSLHAPRHVEVLEVLELVKMIVAKKGGAK